MKTDAQMNYDLLAKHLAGETNEQEQNELKTWLNKDKENPALFQQVHEDWDTLKIMKTMNQFDVDRGWENVQNRIRQASGNEPVIPTEFRRTRFSLISRPFIRIAAAVAFLVMAGLGSYWGYMAHRQASLRTVATSGSDDKTRIILPDGTVVFLNADTRITYMKHFNETLREVRLTGEAYFDVTPDPEKPFVIYTGDAGIKVVGTSFNVSADKASDNIEVYVESGRVELFEADNRQNAMAIEPGYIGSMKRQEITKTINTNSNYLAWKTKKLYFEETDLSAVAKGIQDVFKVQVVFGNPDLARCRYTGKFEDNESLEMVLEPICTIFNATWTRKDNTIVIAGPGC